ncbi:MAG: helix-turn-helix domain-containing protein [Candidatus Paceibacterota bacterium]
MAKPKLKEKVIKLRKQGKSYSQIREEVDVAKSTLSRWLQNYPLSKQRIKELQADNPRRIEKFRETMRKKREAEFAEFLSIAKERIGVISDREKFIAGFFLYWGEGAKTQRYSISVSNTDPAILIAFIEWLDMLNVPKHKKKATIHIYKDMDPRKEVSYWSKTLGLPISQFRKPYEKKSNRSDHTYKSRYSHGTCNVSVDDKDTAYFVHMGMRHIRQQYIDCA